MSASIIQMAGWMGTGKSTVAAAVSRQRAVVVLDHDTTKSALLSAGIPHPPAGAASYEVLYELAEDLARQGHSVIIDSPSLYASIPQRGLAIAQRLGVGYYFVECVCSDEVAESRILARTARRSQVVSNTEAASVRRDPARAPHRPASGACVVDTTHDVGECVQQILSYLDSPGVTPRPSP